MNLAAEVDPPLALLEAEAAQGWPVPWWPQDRPGRRGTGWRSRRGCCVRGHTFDEANTSWRLLAGRLRRHCRACKRLTNRGVLGPGRDLSDTAVLLLIAAEAP